MLKTESKNHRKRVKSVMQTLYLIKHHKIYQKMLLLGCQGEILSIFSYFSLWAPMTKCTHFFQKNLFLNGFQSKSSQKRYLKCIKHDFLKKRNRQLAKSPSSNLIRWYFDEILFFSKILLTRCRWGRRNPSAVFYMEECFTWP